MAAQEKPQVLVEKPGDAPIYTFNPRLGLEKEFYPKSSVPQTPDMMAWSLDDGLKFTLSDAAYARLTTQPASVLVMGPDYECEGFLHGLPKVFKALERLAFVDIDLGTLGWLQRTAREKSLSGLKGKVELYHADFADMRIVPRKSFDVVIADNVFTDTIWDYPNTRLAFAGKPPVPYAQMAATLAQWGREAAALLKEEPPGMLYTIYNHPTTYLGEQGFHHRQPKGHSGHPLPYVLWCRDDSVFKPSSP